MTRIIMERLGHRSIDQGTDEALVGFPVPSECTLEMVRFGSTIVREGSIDVEKVSAYGAHWFFLPLLDPDAGDSLDTIWDELVPKSQPSIDMDLGDSAFTDAVWEPGQEVRGALFDMTVSVPELMYKREKYLTFADVSTGYTAGTPDKFVPVDRFHGSINKRYRARSSAVAIFGVGSPDFVEQVTQTKIFATQTGVAERSFWAMTKYIDHVVEAMMWDVIGMGAEGASGATLPFEDATIFLQGLLSDFGVVDTTRFAGATYSTTVQAKAIINVPGDISVQTLKAGY